MDYARRIKKLASSLDKQKDLAYKERNMLLAWLVTEVENKDGYNVYRALHSEDDKEWDDDWRNIIVIEHNGKQHSWHIPDNMFYLFENLKLIKRYVWDGHTTKEKYDSIRDIIGNYWND